MGRSPCCDKTRVKRGPWSPEEDKTLKNYLSKHGSCGNWIALPRKAGLNRCGKSCRLRWLNYLRPDIKHGGFTKEEDNIIFTLYNTIGSRHRWSIIASKLPGLRTDNDVKNYWNTKLKKKLMSQKTTRYSNYHNNETITKCDNIEISNCTSSTFLTASSAALPYLMDPNFLLKIDYEQQLNSDPIDQFPYLRNIVDVSKFVVSSSPSDQEEESPSVSTNSSATLALENTCYNNEDEVLKHLAFDSCNDVFLNDFGFQTNS